MNDENNTPLKKSRNLKIDSFPKISKTYTTFKRGIKNKYLSKNSKKRIINNEKITYSNFKLIQKNLLRYRTSQKRYQKIIINNLIASVKGHYYAQFKDKLIIEYNGEFLKRFYRIKESYERIPKFAKYYRNYLKFFCKSIFSNLYFNKLIHDFNEKRARIYYRFQKQKKDKEQNKYKLNPKNNLKNERSSLRTIFDKSVRENIGESFSHNFVNSFISNAQNETIPDKTSFHSFNASYETSIKSILDLFKIDNLKKKNEKNKKLKPNSKNNKKKIKNFQKKKKINTDINYFNIGIKKKKFINYKPVIQINNISPNILNQMKLKSLKYIKKNSFSESQITKTNKGKSKSKSKEKDNLSTRIVNKNKTRNLKTKPFLYLDSESLTSRILKTDTQFLTTSKEFSVEKKNSSSNKNSNNKSKKKIKLLDFITLSTIRNLNKKVKNKNYHINVSKDNSSKKEKSINTVIKKNLEFYGINQIKRSRNKAKRIIKIENENENEYYNSTTYKITKDDINGINDIFKTNNSLSTSSKIMRTSILSSISNYLNNYSHNKGICNNPTKVFNNQKIKHGCSDLNNLSLKNNFILKNYKMKNVYKEKKNIFKKK